MLKSHFNNVLLMFHYWVSFKIDLPHTKFKLQSIEMVLQSGFSNCPHTPNKNLTYTNTYLKRTLVSEVEPNAKLTKF